MAPRIWVGDLAAYNAGHLHGEWIELEGMDAADLPAKIEAILFAGQNLYEKETLSHHEEWFIADSDEFFGIHIGEYDSIERVVRLAELVIEHGEPFALYARESSTEDLDEVESEFEDRFCGEYEDGEDWAWSEFEELWPETYKLVTDSPVPGVSFDPHQYVRDSDELIIRNSNYNVYVYRSN